MNRFTTLFIVLAFMICLSGAAMAQVDPPKPKNPPVEKTLSAKDFYKSLAGDWKGSYSLWTSPGAAAQESDINARFQETGKGNYYLMTYTWKKVGVTQDGIFLFGGEGSLATANWGDSFHMKPETMACKGELSDDGKKLILNGSYTAGEGSDWGWRTEFTLKSADSLVMEAYNISPEGEEALAVRANLSRAANDKKRAN